MKHIPRKRFGQHFLSDQMIVERIVASLAPRPGDHLIEIGPGQGALTLPVLKRHKFLEAVELDKDLIPDLKERVKRAGELQIYESDVLDFDFASIKKDGRLLRVFGNLPYNISTPLIFHLLTYVPIIKDMLFMLQKEVAERLAAKPRTEHYGRLSVMVQYHCDVELLFDVPPQAFFPPPKVESSIVRLVPLANHRPLAKDEEKFAAIVKQAFGQRRKTLRNSLKNLVASEVWERANLSASARPEELSVQDFIALSNI